MAYQPLTPEQYSAARQKFSPEQIIAFEQKRRAASQNDQSSSTSPSSNAFGNAAGGLSAGFAKGEVSTIKGLSDIGLKIADQTAGRFVNLFKGNGFKPTNTASTAGFTQAVGGEGNVKKLTQPTGTAENVGYYGEKAAEFLLPGGVASKATKTADTAIDGMNLVDKLGPAIGKTANVALKGAARALSEGAAATGVATAQTGSPTEGLKTGAVAAIASPIVEGMVSLLPKTAEILQQVSMRLSPADKRNFASKLGDVSEYMLKNNVIGTAKQQSEKLDSLFNETENKFQTDFINKAKEKGVTIDKSEAKKLLLQAKEVAMRDNSEAEQVGNQFDKAISNLDTQYGSNKIPIDRFNALKRSTFKNAFNEKGNKVISESGAAIGDVFKGMIEKATKGLKSGGKDIENFNKDYGSLITARKLMAAAESKSPRLVEKVISAIVGGATGSLIGPGYETAGAIGGLVAAPAEKAAIDIGTSAAGNLAKRAAAPIPSTLLKQTPKAILPFVNGKQ